MPIANGQLPGWSRCPRVPRMGASFRGHSLTAFPSIPIIRAPKVGSVAQSVEQRTFNPLVPSSNLGRPTSIAGNGALAQLVEQRTLNP